MNKRIIKLYIILPIIIFSIFGLIEVPKSQAKYIKEDSFTYQKADLSKLSYYNNDAYSKLNLTYNIRSTYKRAYLDVEFLTNNIMYDTNSKDTYLITIRNNGNNSCSIADGSVYSVNGTGTYNGIYNSTAKVTYEDIVNPSDSIRFRVVCNVDDSSSNENDPILAFGITVTEMIDDETPFTYIKLDKNILPADYYIEGIREKPSNGAFYTEAYAKLHDYYENVVNADNLDAEETGTIWYAFTQYFNSVFNPDISNDDFEANKDNLRGFKFTIDEDGNRTYKFDGTYLGYAMSKYLYEHNNSEGLNQFAFSNQSNLTVGQKEEIFRYYLANYSTETIRNYDADKIINYINRYNGGMNAIFDHKIPQIIATTSDSDKYKIGYTVVQFTDALTSAINNINSTSHKELLNFQDKSQTWSRSFVLTLRSNYDFISNLPNSEFVTLFNTSSGDLYESVTRNSGIGKTNSDAVAFSDFHIESYTKSDSTTLNVLYNIYSPSQIGVDDNLNTKTYFNAYEIKAGNEIVLSIPEGVSDSSAIDAINKINKIVHGESTSEISSLGTSYLTETIDGVEHEMYEVAHDFGSVTYDTYYSEITESNIVDGVTYTHTYRIMNIKYIIN